MASTLHAASINRDPCSRRRARKDLPRLLQLRRFAGDGLHITPHQSLRSEQSSATPDRQQSVRRLNEAAGAANATREARSSARATLWVTRRLRPTTNFPRKTRLSTLTGKKKRSRGWTHCVRLGERPPTGITQCTCGWCSRFWPQVWSTLRKPIAAPRCVARIGNSNGISALAPCQRPPLAATPRTYLLPRTPHAATVRGAAATVFPRRWGHARRGWTPLPPGSSSGGRWRGRQWRMGVLRM